LVFEAASFNQLLISLQLTVTSFDLVVDSPQYTITIRYGTDTINHVGVQDFIITESTLKRLNIDWQHTSKLEYALQRVPTRAKADAEIERRVG